MEKRGHSASPIGEGPPTKIRRSTRACLQCRARKQKCLPLLDAEGHPPSCRRCQQLDITCSFVTEPVDDGKATPTPSRVAEIIVELQHGFKVHEQRLAILEERSRNNSLPGRVPSSEARNQAANQTSTNTLQNPTADASTASTGTVVSPAFSFDQLTLGPPIATLRDLDALSKAERRVEDVPPGFQARKPPVDPDEQFDPIVQRVMSAGDAERAVEIFFRHCHPLAPLLSIKWACSAHNLQQTSPRLLLAICSIGARFWIGENQYEMESIHDVHPSYFDLIVLLDKAVSRLLLRPSTSDINLESVQILLLYAQWMPHDKKRLEMGPTGRPAAQYSYKSRYNDTSAWAVLGVAARYARLLNLDQRAVAVFRDTNPSPTAEDMAMVRALNNLLTCDYNLMLSSGLAASIDPVPAANIAEAFGSHPAAQQPSDLRVAALVQLVSIAHRANLTCGDSSGRRLDAASLRKANAEFDDWERHWVKRLCHTESQHNQLPFTSARWYRLALNSASLGSILSPSESSERQRLQIWLLQALETSLTAASQMLLSLSQWGQKHVWTIDSQDKSSFPSGPFVVDISACRRLQYAVDSTWISHTFAIAFLILCYIRGAIDDNLRISVVGQSTASQIKAPTTPRPDSLVMRLVRLGNDVFERVCMAATVHPANDFRVVILNATSLIMPNDPAVAEDGQALDTSAMQAFSDLMKDFDMEWPGNLFDFSESSNTYWDNDFLSTL